MFYIVCCANGAPMYGTADLNAAIAYANANSSPGAMAWVMQVQGTCVHAAAGPALHAPK